MRTSTKDLKGQSGFFKLPKRPELLCLATLCLLCCSPPKDTFDLLITNVRILDVQNGSIENNRFVGISNDTIRLVGPMGEAGKYDSEETLDAQGKYVLPGLWDMHVHFRGGDSLINENKELLGLFLDYGVTTVRDAGGDLTPFLLKWQKEIIEKKLTGPYIFTPGPKLDGPNPTWEGSIELTSVDEVKLALDSLQTLNAAYVKIYDSQLDKETYYHILKEAEARGMKTTGHMPMSASFDKAIDHGLDGSEHLYYILKACSAKEDSLTALDRGYGILPELVVTYDSAKAEKLFQKMAEKGVTITPTLFIGSVLNGLADTDHTNDKLLPRIGEGIQKTYARRINAAKRASEQTRKDRKALEKLFLSMVRPMHDRGVTIYAGSDCGPYNSYVYPGESLHGELKALVKAGLTPREALECSIINGPAFFGLERFYGSVGAGKVADLILLGQNPLDDIENIGSIAFVIMKGQVLTRS